MLAITFRMPAWRYVAAKLAGKLDDRAFIGRLGGLRLAEVPEPALPGDDWVLCQPRLGGICGTDVAFVTLRSHPGSMLRSFASFPMLLGHENVCVVRRVGKAVAAVRVGQRVVVEPSLSCRPRGIEPVCPSCRAGTFSLCERFADGALPPATMIGYNRFTGGSWSQRLVAHESQLVPVPDAVDDRAAVLTDPLACGLHAALRCRPATTDRVLVIGDGMLAMALIASIRALGGRCRISVLLRSQRFADRLTRLGADRLLPAPPGESKAVLYDRVAGDVEARRVPGPFGNQSMLGGYDVVYDCVGTGRTLSDAMKFARARGRVVALGTAGIGLVETTPLWFSELTVTGCNGRQIETFEGRPMHTYQAVFELMASRRLKTDGLLTHTFGLSEYREAFEAVMHRTASGCVKAAFVHDA